MTGVVNPTGRWLVLSDPESTDHKEKRLGIAQWSRCVTDKDEDRTGEGRPMGGVD